VKYLWIILGESGRQANSTDFIEFMLGAIDASLKELPSRKISDIVSDKISDKLSRAELNFLTAIMGYLENNGEIDNYRAQLLTNKAPQTINGLFAALVSAGVLTAIGRNKGRKYRLNKV